MIDIGSLSEKEVEAVVEEEVCFQCGGKLSPDLKNQERIEYYCEDCDTIYVLFLIERPRKAYPDLYESHSYVGDPADRTFVLL